MGLGNASRDAELELAVEVLRRTEIFRALDDDALTRLAVASRRRTYGKGQFVFYQGDSGDTLLVVCDGLVKVVFTSETGEETVSSLSEPVRSSGRSRFWTGQSVRRRSSPWNRRPAFS